MVNLGSIDLSYEETKRLCQFGIPQFSTTIFKDRLKEFSIGLWECQIYMVIPKVISILVDIPHGERFFQVWSSMVAKHFVHKNGFCIISFYIQYFSCHGVENICRPSVITCPGITLVARD